MMRLVKFGGVLTVPVETTTKDGFDKILKIMKDNQYHAKTEEEVSEYIEFRNKKANDSFVNEVLF